MRRIHASPGPQVVRRAFSRVVLGAGERLVDDPGDALIWLVRKCPDTLERLESLSIPA
jgi:hypothetical protein